MENKSEVNWGSVEMKADKVLKKTVLKSDWFTWQMLKEVITKSFYSMSLLLRNHGHMHSLNLSNPAWWAGQGLSSIGEEIWLSPTHVDRDQKSWDLNPTFRIQIQFFSKISFNITWLKSQYGYVCIYIFTYTHYNQIIQGKKPNSICSSEFCSCMVNV